MEKSRYFIMKKYRFGVSSKLILAFSLFTIAVIAAGAGSIFYINKMGDVFGGIYHENMRSLENAHKLEVNLRQVIINSYRYLGTQDPDSLIVIEKIVLKDIENIKEEFSKNTEKYKDISKKFLEVEGLIKSIFALHFDFNTQQAYELINSDGQKIFIEIENMVSAISGDENKNASLALQSGLEIKEGIILYLILVMVARVLLNSSIAIVIYRSISKPLIELSKFISYITRTGDFSKRIEINHKDEMGDAARAINELTASLQKIIDNVGGVLVGFSQGNFHQRIDLDYVGDLKKLKDSINTTATQTGKTISKNTIPINKIKRPSKTPINYPQ